ncbi:hypothetical protein IFM89_010808 [Coptis chinensis]|uniref:Uncharacterized protein n=1 Tax=Coptis chinensis TaxID=261450 RepID=A0A835IMT4_9MAGN|nr:hypothetical protein IFM89_010808 [Coptis chinensis]
MLVDMLNQHISEAYGRSKKPSCKTTLAKEGESIAFHKPSTIWSGIKLALAEVLPRTHWIIGNGKTIDLWRDCWLHGQSLQHIMNLSSDILKGCIATLDMIIHNDEWRIPKELQFLLDEHGIDLHSLEKPNSSAADERVWTPELRGNFTVKSAFVEIRSTLATTCWSRVVWKNSIHPQLSAIAWKLVYKCATTQESMKKKEVQLTSRCCVCRCNSEDLDHLLWNCGFVHDLWKWIADKFQVEATFASFTEAINMGTCLSPRLRDLWLFAVLGGVMLTNASLSKSFSNLQDKDVLNNWGIERKLRRAPRIQPCWWTLPDNGVLKLNTDGASKGNHGPAVVGVSARNSGGSFEFVYCRNIGVTTSYVSECIAILEGIEIAVSKGYTAIWVESDSKVVAAAYNTKNIP